MANTCINLQGVQYVRDHLAKLPRPDLEAKQAIGRWLTNHGIGEDPDQIDVVTLHIHAAGPGRYQAEIKQRISLTQAVLINWQGESDNDVFAALFDKPWAGRLPSDGDIEIVDRLPAQPVLDHSAWYQVFNGLFRRTEPATFNHSTLVDIRAEVLQRHIEALDFHTRYRSLLDDYWQTHLAGYRLCCKLNFIAACNKQVAQGTLSEAARKLAWRAAELIPRGKGLRLSTLSIYGYAATDLLYINEAQSDLTLLYAPGNSSPLLEFASENLLKDWVGEHCKDGAWRAQFKRHFRLADGPQGVDFSGLDTALDGMAEYPARHTLPPEHGPFNDDGVWPPRTYVNYRPRTYNPRIRGDLFQALAERHRQRSYDDADFIITSNRELTESKWRGYLNATLNLLAPLTFVVPGLAPLLAVGGIVQLGLGLDQAINAKTLHNKLEGIGDIAYGLLNATPLALGAITKADALYESWQEGFIAPRRLNEQIGYPLSPLDPPHLPQVDVAPYFHRPKRIQPLTDCDPDVADSIHRYPQYNGEPDELIGYYEERPDYVEQMSLAYDMETDLFIRRSDINETDPVYFRAEPGTGNVCPANPHERPVTHAMRMSSMRAMGIDVSLPFEVPSAQVEGAYAIPKQISSLWVGDRVIGKDILDNLATNAQTLTDSPYRYRLFLSQRNPEVFAENLAQLQARAPGLQVLPLEEQDFFKAFEQHKNFAQ